MREPPVGLSAARSSPSQSAGSALQHCAPRTAFRLATLDVFRCLYPCISFQFQTTVSVTLDAPPTAALL